MSQLDGTGCCRAAMVRVVQLFESFVTAESGGVSSANRSSTARGMAASGSSQGGKAWRQRRRQRCLAILVAQTNRHAPESELVPPK